MSVEKSMGQPNRRTMDIFGRKCEVIDVDILEPSQIEQGDRVMVTTESGNRYMIRRSKSRGGDLMIYNKKDGYEKGEVLHDQKGALTKGIIAKVGEPIKLWVVLDSDKQLGSEMKSTNVESIEIRKKIEQILDSIPENEGKINFTQMLIDHGTGRKPIK